MVQIIVSDPVRPTVDIVIGKLKNEQLKKMKMERSIDELLGSAARRVRQTHSPNQANVE